MAYNVDQLLQELEPLDHVQRMQRMISIGRHASNKSLESQKLLDDLIKSTETDEDSLSVYKRMLALQSCFSSGDPKLALDCLCCPSKFLSCRAVKFVVLLATDDSILKAVESLAPATLILLIKKLKYAKRESLVDRLIEAVRHAPQRLFLHLLPQGSQDFVRANMTAEQYRLDQQNWRKLVRWHPKTTLEALLAWIKRVPANDRRLIIYINSMLPMFVGADISPHSVVDIFRALGNNVDFNEFDCATVNLLFQHYPKEFVEFVVNSRSKVFFETGKALKQLDFDELIRLHRYHEPLVNRWNFDQLSPEMRVAFFGFVEKKWRDDSGFGVPDVAGLLPTRERVQEARRNLDLPAMKSSTILMLEFSALLPWEESLARISPYLKGREDNVRSIALRAIIRATKYQREKLSEALQIVIRAKNESLATRYSMLDELQQLPSSILKTGHILAMETVIQHSLDAIAREDYQGTTAALKSLIWRFFACHRKRAAALLAKVFRERSHVESWTPPRTQTLDTKSILDLEEALIPVLESWRSKNDKDLMVQVIGTFKAYLKNMPRILDFTEHLLKENMNASSLSTCLDCLKQYRHAQARSLVPELLAGDRSWIFEAFPRSVLHRKKQSALDQYLISGQWQGIFNTDGKRRLLFFDVGFSRWTPTQQKNYTETLLWDVRNPDLPPNHQCKCVNQLSRLLFVPSMTLLLDSLASDERVPIRQAALITLGRLDQGNGTDSLIKALEDDECAAVAICSLRSPLQLKSSEETLQILKTAPLRKVGVGKEVVRLIADLDTEESYAHLVELERSKVHKDIRIAILNRLKTYYDRESTWKIFNRAARDSEPSVAETVIVMPLEVESSKELNEAFIDLLLLTLSHSNHIVRLSTLRELQSAPIEDPNGRLADICVKLLQSEIPAEAKGASNAIMQIYTKSSPKIVSGIFESSINEAKILKQLFSSFASHIPVSMNQELEVISTARAVLKVLQSSPFLLQLSIPIIFRTNFPATEFHMKLFNLIPQLHPAALAYAADEILDGQLLDRSDLDVEALERELFARAEENARYLGLHVLLVLATGPQKWTRELEARLEGYRSDESTMVRSAAVFVEPPQTDLWRPTFY